MVSVPYVKELSEHFRRKLERENIKVIFKGVHTIKPLLIHPKDPNSINLKQYVIYNWSSPVEDINATYEEESVRCLEMRIRDHSKGIQSNIQLHILERNHAIADISHFNITD